MPLTHKLAEFVQSLTMESIPPRVVERARACLLNGYGIALGGLTTPYHRTATTAALAMDGEIKGGATLLGAGRRTSLSRATVVNGSLFHGRAQEDTCGTVHLGAIVIPMLTAMVETERLPMDRFIPALVAGYEIAGAFDRPYGVKTAPMGLRASPLYGTLGAAAAASRLLGLDVAQTAAALANAAAFTGGILQSFSDGTDEWRYQVGVAARNGLLAAQLAQAGSVSAPRALEGTAGFVRAYVREECDVAAIEAALGIQWSTERVTFKPYPVCAFNQTPVEAALALRETLREKGVSANDLDSVTVRMNPYETGYAGMLENGPFRSLSATLMSISFCVATTLLYGVPDMRRMTTFDDPAVTALIGQMQVLTDSSVPNLCTRIEATAGDVRVEQDQRMTAADYAFDRPRVSALVRRIGAEQGLPERVYDRLESFVDGLPAGDIDEVIELFRSSAQA